MKYILLMNGTKSGVEAYRTWSESDIKRHFNHLDTFRKTLRASREFVATNGLGLPHEAFVVRSGRNGTPVTDGVFPEAKEFLLGYWIIDVDTEDRACDIAALLSAGPGPGDVPLNMPIEVRRVMTESEHSRS